MLFTYVKQILVRLQNAVHCLLDHEYAIYSPYSKILFWKQNLKDLSPIQ